MYVYIKSEPNLYTVGFYKPDGTWEPESDYENREDAANRVHWLNSTKPRSRLSERVPYKNMVA